MSSRINPLSKKNYALLIACLIFLFGFLLVTFFRSSFFSVDIAVNRWIPAIQSTTLTFLAEVIALVFDTISLIILSVVISSILFLKNYRIHGLLLLVGMGGIALMVSLIKAFIQIARPINGIILDMGFSYPSGHSAGCIVFGGIIAYFAWLRWKSTLSRTLIVAGMALLAVLVGFDRIYLSVHWLSDIIGGWFLGAFWLTFVISVFQQIQFVKKKSESSLESIHSKKFLKNSLEPALELDK